MSPFFKLKKTQNFKQLHWLRVTKVIFFKMSNAKIIHVTCWLF
ncbi:hypothetical protein ALT785_270074 [Alteromonas infernus]